MFGEHFLYTEIPDFTQILLRPMQLQLVILEAVLEISDRPVIRDDQKVYWATKF